MLGLLSLQPMSDYMIRKRISYSIGHFWHGTYGHIYPTLKQLEAQGLVSHRAEKSGTVPSRHNFNGYALTWMTRPPADVG